MSALTDYFTSMANKIRSKVGGSQTYTPLQMVNAIDDVYDAGAASVPSPTSITPSDSSPAALTANTPVTPTANGYAIASSPTSVTPSTSGASFTAGIKNMTGSGYAYSQKPTPSSSLKASGAFTSGSGSQTLSSLTVGKTYLLTLASYANSAANASDRCNVTSVTNGSKTTIQSPTSTNTTSNIYLGRSAYILVPTSTSMKITVSLATQAPEYQLFDLG